MSNNGFKHIYRSGVKYHELYDLGISSTSKKSTDTSHVYLYESTENVIYANNEARLNKDKNEIIGKTNVKGNSIIKSNTPTTIDLNTDFFSNLSTMYETTKNKLSVAINNIDTSNKLIPFEQALYDSAAKIDIADNTVGNTNPVKIRLGDILFIKKDHVITSPILVTTTNVEDEDVILDMLIDESTTLPLGLTKESYKFTAVKNIGDYYIYIPTCISKISETEGTTLYFKDFNDGNINIEYILKNNSDAWEDL